MDTRATGIAALGAKRAAARAAAAHAAAVQVGDHGFGWLVTPGQIEAKAAELGASFDSFDRAVEAFEPADVSKADDWKSWRAAWKDFRSSFEALRYKIANDPPLPFTSRWSGGTADLLLQYQDRLAQWREEFQRQWGITPPGPAVAPVPEARSEETDKREPRWKEIATGVAIGVGTAIVLYGLRKLVVKP